MDEMRDEKCKLAGIRSRNTAHLLDSYCFGVVAQMADGLDDDALQVLSMGLCG